MLKPTNIHGIEKHQRENGMNGQRQVLKAQLTGHLDITTLKLQK